MITRDEYLLAEFKDEKIALITGCNRGLGYEVALQLAKKGYVIVMGCRNRENAENAKEKMLAAAQNDDIDAKIYIPDQALNLSNFDSVRDFAEEIVAKFDHLDLLVNNAGANFEKFGVTINGYEETAQANYLSQVLLTEKLLPLLIVNDLRDAETRIVSVTSAAQSFANLKPKSFLAKYEEGAKNHKYNNNDAYSDSKLAIQIFNLSLAKLFKKYNITIKSVTAHPGMVQVERAPQSLFLQFFEGVKKHIVKQSVAKGAASIEYACIGQDINSEDYCGPDGIGGLRGNPTKVEPSSAALKAFKNGVAEQLNTFAKQAGIDIESSFQNELNKFLLTQFAHKILDEKDQIIIENSDDENEKHVRVIRRI